MTTRLEKLERIKGGKVEGSNVNQTIIINNPNININYVGENRGPLSSRGLDNWHLNNNLKEFSQTRQVGFFNSKIKKDRNKSNSPYVIHKVRTQDLRSINKIYAPCGTFKETLPNFRKNQTISHIQPVTGEREKEGVQSPLEKIATRWQKTITDKFYQGQIRKNLRIEQQRNFQTLPTTYLANPEANPSETNHPKTFRNRRFEVAVEKVGMSERKVQSRESSESIESPERCVKLDQVEEKDSALSERKVDKIMTVRAVPYELKRRAFNKTIASIDRVLLSNTEKYFQGLHGQKLPQAKIELFVNSMSHPEAGEGAKERSSQVEFSEQGQYDFQFEEERKKRPKTPRKKKLYEQE